VFTVSPAAAADSPIFIIDSLMINSRLTLPQGETLW
jgi:hypothetical protein